MWPVKVSQKNSPRFTCVEQSTIVHEIGHAIGLVNNGVPATTAHHDGQTVPTAPILNV